jgi:uncharacterized membrane protein YkvA (DUF1232 family)
VLANFQQHVRELKRETIALYFAARHPLTPWYAKLFVGILVAYALSPIDLIPDFIPVLGYLDDLVLIPLGIVLAIKLIPDPVLIECRAQAALLQGKPVNRLAAFIIILIWLGLATFAGYFLYRTFYV